MPPIVECRALCKSYGNISALDKLDLVVGEGRIVGLLGPNGSGKTTFLKLCAGLLVPSSGDLLVCGGPVGSRSKALVSYLPDQSYLPAGMNSRQAIQLFSDFYSDFDAARALEMISRLGISPVQNFKSLSKGTKEKVQLVLVMSRRAMLYILDEPIGGVDPATRDFILETVVANRHEGSSVIISTHLLSDVEAILDDVVFLNSGRITYAGSADEMRTAHGKSIDAVFREEFKC